MWWIQRQYESSNQVHAKIPKENFSRYWYYKRILEEEMFIRFERQDEIIDNLSNFIKRFQDTLKVVSANSW